MSLVKDTIGNFIGGVSQQPDKLMYPNQSKRLVNFQLSPSVGLKDRPPTEHIRKLIDTQDIHPLCTTVIKEDDDYEVVLTGDDVRVFGLDGVERGVEVDILEGTTGTTETYSYALVERKVTNKKKTAALYKYTVGTMTLWFKGSYSETKNKKTGAVTKTWDKLKKDKKLYTNKACSSQYYYGIVQSIDTTNQVVTILRPNKNVVDYDPLDYITSDNPLKELTTATVGAYTFIVNRTVKTKMLSDKPTNPFKNGALIFVKQGNYKADYKILVNGTEVATYTATDDIATTKTNAIARNLYDDLVSNLNPSGQTAQWIIDLKGSVIALRKVNNGAFTIQTIDSNAHRDLFSFYRTAEDLSVLPTVAPNGFILKIIGENINIADDYYVKFQTSDGSNFGTGSWQECCSPDVTYKIDPRTMPVALVRNDDGNFVLTTIDWANRQAGDEESAPTPSFIGNTIQDIFAHKGRLALLAEDKVIFSDTEDVFSFFKKTTLTELETDPIDIGSNSKMVLLQHSLPYNEALLLFSYNSEFTIRGGDVFSNNTVACDLTMEYACSPYCKPVNSSNYGYFVYENGDYSRAMEIYITNTYTTDARDITEQAPSYLPKGIFKIASSPANSMLCFLSTETPEKVYVYNYYYTSENKAQSAWSEWEFEGGKVINVDFKENYCYLVIQYSDGIYLNRMNFTQQYKEPNLNYLFYLDRKVYYDVNETYTDIDDISYSLENGNTVITLPYTPSTNFHVIDSRGFPLTYTLDGTTCTIEGEHDRVVVGNTFTSLWELPLIFLRQESSSGGLKVREGILMLRDINLTYANTGYFRIKVTPKYTTNITSTFEYTGKILGMASATIGQMNVADGTFLLPVIAKNDEVKIEVINDNYMPSCFLSLEWLGDFTVRGQRS